MATYRLVVVLDGDITSPAAIHPPWDPWDCVGALVRMTDEDRALHLTFVKG